MQNLVRAYQEVFSSEDEIKIVKSPLRICPLGAHIDHQRGLVTGMTLNSSVNLVYSPNDSGLIRIRSLDFPDEEYYNVDHVPGMIPGFWGNYLRGSILSLRQDHVIKRGIVGVISGRLPIGGLSSSAAVTTAYLMALCDVNNIKVSKMDLIRYSHWVETEFIGLNNGILDQAANILSENNKLMVMDCATEEYKLIEKHTQMPNFEVIIVYSGLSKALMGTDYNNRVDECRVSAWLLQELANQEIAAFSETTLRDIDEDTYQQLRAELPGRFKRRADHFFGEIKRVKQGIKAWETGDIQKFGRLMFESGESSINKYESGCPELITIYNILRNCQGVYGARFSGAGYRGCCIGLVDPRYKEEISDNIKRIYPRSHPQYKDSYNIYYCTTDDGARIISDISQINGEVAQ